jgi:hypothetical protein
VYGISVKTVLDIDLAWKEGELVAMDFSSVRFIWIELSCDCALIAVYGISVRTVLDIDLAWNGGKVMVMRFSFLRLNILIFLIAFEMLFHVFRKALGAVSDNLGCLYDQLAFLMVDIVAVSYAYEVCPKRGECDMMQS